MSGVSKTAACLCLLLLVILQPYHLYLLSLLQSIILLACLLDTRQLLYCITVLFKLLYCNIKNVFFFVFLIYYFCEKYDKPIIVQCHIPNCVSWIPRLTLFLGLTSKLDLQMCSWNRTHFYVGNLLYSDLKVC